MEYESGTTYAYRQLEKAIENDIPYSKMDMIGWIKEDFTERFFRYLEDKLDKDLCKNIEYKEEEKISIWKEKLKKAAAKKSVSIDKNVLYKWFPTEAKETNDPVTGDQRTRPKIYCLAYVLDLKYSNNPDKDEIMGFFHRVFRARPYDLKDKQEVVWWYYLNRGDFDWYTKGLEFYKQLEQQRELLGSEVLADDLSIEKLQVFFTEDVEKAIKNIQTEERLRSFILLNWDVLKEKNRLLTAQKSVQHHAKQAEYWAEVECKECPEKNITKKSFSRESKRDDEWADPSSNFLLSTITGVNTRVGEVVSETIHIFPAYYDLDKVLKGHNVSVATLRKLLIILKLYCYTYSKIYYAYAPSCASDLESTYSKEKCIKQINFALKRAGFYPLYPYDEYDLLFLYAIGTGSSNPVEVLRKIIVEL